MPKKVVMTGAAGYLGSVICGRLLEAGYSVIALDNLMYGQHSLLQYCHNPRFDFVLGDARNRETMARLLKDADAIIPLAALVGAPACDRDPLLARSVNTDAVRMLLELRSPNQLVVFPNTNSGYGARPAISTAPRIPPSIRSRSTAVPRSRPRPLFSTRRIPSPSGSPPSSASPRECA